MQVQKPESANKRTVIREIRGVADSPKEAVKMKKYDR